VIDGGQAVWLAPSHYEFGCVANLFSFHQTKDDLINEVFSVTQNVGSYKSKISYSECFVNI
jgi:hypothetical protein